MRTLQSLMKLSASSLDFSNLKYSILGQLLCEDSCGTGIERGMKPMPYCSILVAERLIMTPSSLGYHSWAKWPEMAVFLPYDF